jgi:type IV pilus assembly protein PilW
MSMNVTYSRSRPSGRAKGLSLIELMIGLTIGLTLTLGLTTLIAGTSSTFKTQDDFSRIQENATAALRYIGDSVRMAGFYGYVMDATNINMVAGGVNTTTDCGSATNPPSVNWALSIAPAVPTPVFGFYGLTPLNVNATFPCIQASNFAAGIGPNPNPILVTRGAGGFRVPDPNGDGDRSDGLAAQPNFNTTIYIQSDPTQGLVFYGADFAALKGGNATRRMPNGSDVDIFEYRAYVYYIRPCSRPVGGVPNCTGAGDDAGHPLPTLVRQELAGSAMTEVALVEGIDMMNIQYGVDLQPANAPDGVPEFFTDNPAGNWGNVVAVKITLLVRSPSLAITYDDSGKTYDLDGNGVADYRCTDYPAPACSYKRKVFSQTFQVRNVAQRRGA